MGIRRKSRECALQMLYQWDITGIPIDNGIQGFEDRYPLSVRKFSRELVMGTIEHLGEINAIIAEASENWDIERMPYIDRNILRLAVFEIKYRDDIPYKVSINEAIELGKKFGSDQSGKFINGILDNITPRPSEKQSLK